MVRFWLSMTQVICQHSSLASRQSSEKYSVHVAKLTVFQDKKTSKFGLVNRKIPILQFLKILEFCQGRKL